MEDNTIKKNALYADEVFQYDCEHKLIYAKNGGVNNTQEQENNQSESSENDD